MIKRVDDINDDQIRVLGRQGKPDSTPARSGHDRKPVYIGAAILVVILALLGIVFGLKHGHSAENAQETELEMALYDPEPVETVDLEPVTPLGNYADDSDKAYTEHLKQTINDIPLDIYIPHNASPELCIGVPDMFDKSIVLTTQAADIRADNGKIVGAFVLKGEPLAWGLSKKGYCAIIDGKVSIGVADNSPLFEEATEKGGYFFRQYPLVDNGKLVENELKGKSVRKAICDRAGEIMVVMTETPESLHDFAQALVDLRVDNAVYLVGSNSYGYFRDKFDHFTQIYEKTRGGQKFENFVVWNSIH